VTDYQVTYWRALPSLVVAREGESVTKGLLDGRFQEAIDEAAMRLGATGSDAYLDGWMRSEWTPAEGSGVEVCDRVVADLEAQWPAEKLAEYLDGLA
jgi:Virulence factor